MSVRLIDGPSGQYVEIHWQEGSEEEKLACAKCGSKKFVPLKHDGQIWRVIPVILADGTGSFLDRERALLKCAACWNVSGVTRAIDAEKPYPLQCLPGFSETAAGEYHSTAYCLKCKKKYKEESRPVAMIYCPECWPELNENADSRRDNHGG